MKPQCTSGDYRRISRWEHEAVTDAAEARLERAPEVMQARRQTVEHPFGTLKAWMGATHFLMKTLPKVSTEMSLHVLAYNMLRVINMLGVSTEPRRDSWRLIGLSQAAKADPCSC